MIEAYEISVAWQGTGPREREHVIRADGAGELLGSAAPTFHGNRERWNPEQLFIASLAQCHMMTYLYLAERVQLRIVSYADHATGTLRTHPDGSGEFVEVILRPCVDIVDGSRREEAQALHDEVGKYCFIERSVAVPVRHIVDTQVRERKD